MVTSTVLTTRRLRLRHWRTSDAKLYDHHCNTPEVMACLGGVMTRQQVRADLAYFARQQELNGFTFWVLERKRDSAFLGFCGLVRVDERSSTVLGQIEVGWRLRSDMWRRGYGFEAATRVLEFGLGKMGIDRIVARVAPRNRASRGLMRKLEMRRVRRLDYVHPADGETLIVYATSRP